MRRLQELLLKMSEAKLHEEERYRLFAELRVVARNNRDEFMTTVRALPFANNNMLFEVYVALAGEPEYWEDFFLEELERLLTAAQSAADPVAVLTHLEAFAYLSANEEGALQRRLRQRFQKEIDAANVAIRRRAIWAIGDFLYASNYDVINKLKQLLAEDRDWRIRYYAYTALECINKVPTEYRQSFLDKARAILLNPFKGLLK